MTQRLKWDYYQASAKIDESGQPRSIFAMYPQEAFFPQGEPPQMPEVYYRYKQVESYQLAWESGGLGDQPHLMMMEFDACQYGENEYRSIELPKLQAIEQAAAVGQQEIERGR